MTGNLPPTPNSRVKTQANFVSPRGPVAESEAPSARRVERLDDRLIDQIAAGEVVERPASVVKELVENALDAGASRIRVEVDGGGIDRIRVRDDGCGMDARDARLALERHATSKLRRADDLDAIASFGFRGEALPAIASVSSLRLWTRRHGDAEGVELRVEGGRVVEQGAPGIAPGTRVDVDALFAQVPARRKFLKQPATEWRHVVDWLSRAALARPDVHFDIQRDGRVASTWPAVHERRERVAAVLSSRESEAMVTVDAAEGAFRLEGFTSRPDVHRAGSGSLYLFVNGRPVRDRLLRHALLEVYRDVLPKGRFPSAVVFLDVPPGEVDVNVHPAKWEVRFRDPRAVHRLVSRGVRRALETRAWLGGPGGAGTPTPNPTRAGTAAPTWGRGGAGRIGDSRTARWGAGPESDPVQRAEWEFAGERDVETAAASASLFAREGDAAPGLRLSALELHGQLHATYLLLEGEDGLLLVDQHTAHERVLYERLRSQWREGGVSQQALLLPATVHLHPRDAARIAEHGEDAVALGFDLEPFGENAYVVRAVPALLADRNPEMLLVELAEAIGRDPNGPPVPRGLDPAEAIFATLACHSARRAGDRLERSEQRALLEAVDSIPWSPTCPHGRPVVVPIPLAEIERRFRRT